MKDLKAAAESANYTATAYREVLERNGVALSFTQGVSMRPLIYQGEGYVAIVPVDEPKVDDVLLFEQMRGGKTVCVLHRLVEIVREGEQTVYVTRGDNCLGCERLLRADIVAKMERVYWKRLPWYNPRRVIPLLIGAKRDGDGRTVSASDAGYLRYVRLWNALWPARRAYKRLRAKAGAIWRRCRTKVKSKK